MIGTTGFSGEEKAEIGATAKDIAIVMAPNMTSASMSCCACSTPRRGR